MRWSSGGSRGKLRSTTIMITSTNANVREVVRNKGLETAAVAQPEVFFGIDAADARQVVTQIVSAESPKRAQGMRSDMLLKRVAERLKAGFRVHCVYEAGPTGFALARQLIALGADCLVVRARQLRTLRPPARARALALGNRLPREWWRPRVLPHSPAHRTALPGAQVTCGTSCCAGPGGRPSQLLFRCRDALLALLGATG